MNNWAYAAKIPASSEEGQTSISVSTSSAATSAVIKSNFAIVYSTVECFIVVGANPTATVATGLPIPANTLVPVSGIRGGIDKIAAIAASGSGTLYIRPN